MYTWQSELKNCITSTAELARHLQLPVDSLATSTGALFPVRIPKPYLAKIKKGDRQDPLLRQVLIDEREKQSIDGYIHDPLQEQKANIMPGLLHKYPSRVLITLSKACAIHCRYCFRRTFDYKNNTPGTQQLDAIFQYVDEHSIINEVILSGGDPLSVTDQRIAYVINALNRSSHVKTLRFHTRFPVVIPSRITKELLNILSNTHLNIVFVLHINHPNEIDNDLKYICSELKKHNITLLNQSVLLKGINDHEEILKKLSEELFTTGILPYYLHLLDPVSGTHHFNVSIDDALPIYHKLQEQLSGYLVPKLVREISGRLSKTQVI